MDTREMKTEHWWTSFAPDVVNDENYGDIVLKGGYHTGL